MEVQGITHVDESEQSKQNTSDSKQETINKMLKTVEQLNHPERMKILRYLSELEIKITEQADGARINLDNMSEIQIEWLNEYIQSLTNLDPLFKIE